MFCNSIITQQFELVNTFLSIFLIFCVDKHNLKRYNINKPIKKGCDRVTVNDRVKVLRKELRLSQPRFGEALGVSRDVISNIELNRVELKDMMINLICKTFNVNPLWLTEGEGEMFFDTPQAIIDDLANEFNLTELEKKIVSNFVNLSESERKQIIETIHKLIT